MYSLLNVVMFHCYVSLPEGTLWGTPTFGKGKWYQHRPQTVQVNQLNQIALSTTLFLGFFSTVYFCTSRVNFCFLKVYLCNLKVYLYFESIPLYLESIPLYFESILLYFERTFVYFEPWKSKAQTLPSRCSKDYTLAPLSLYFRKMGVSRPTTGNHDYSSKNTIMIGKRTWHLAEPFGPSSNPITSPFFPPPQICQQIWQSLSALLCFFVKP